MLKTILDQELSRAPSGGVLSLLYVKAGDVFYAVHAKSDGFCDQSHKAIYQYAFALVH